jgi:hypothetical protein
MEDEEIIVVVFVNLGSLVATSAVFYVQGVELVLVQEETVFLFARIGDVHPFQRLVLDSLYHGLCPPFVFCTQPVSGLMFKILHSCNCLIQTAKIQKKIHS